MTSTPGKPIRDADPNRIGEITPLEQIAQHQPTEAAVIAVYGRLQEMESEIWPIAVRLGLLPAVIVHGYFHGSPHSMTTTEAMQQDLAKFDDIENKINKLMKDLEESKSGKAKSLEQIAKDHAAKGSAPT